MCPVQLKEVKAHIFDIFTTVLIYPTSRNEKIINSMYGVDSQ